MNCHRPSLESTALIWSFFHVLKTFMFWRLSCFEDFHVLKTFIFWRPCLSTWIMCCDGSLLGCRYRRAGIPTVGDLVVLFTFAVIGRYSHGLRSLNWDALQMVDPFIAGQFFQLWEWFCAKALGGFALKCSQMAGRVQLCWCGEVTVGSYFHIHLLWNDDVIVVIVSGVGEYEVAKCLNFGTCLCRMSSRVLLSERLWSWRQRDEWGV
jgi:hypothetical protein